MVCLGDRELWHCAKDVYSSVQYFSTLIAHGLQVPPQCSYVVLSFVCENFVLESDAV